MLNEETTKTELKPKRRRTLLQRIVNVFLYFGLIIFACFVVFFAFSQTQIFKNWLRDYVVELANDNLNGKINIEKIEGTIFTSLILKNTVVAMNDDTLLNAGMIEIRTSPLKIFLKTIYIRKVEIKDTRISLLKDSLGNLNIADLFPASEEEDTSQSHFPFRIEVAEFKLSNVEFSIQHRNKPSSTSYYSSLNLDDFRVRNINLLLKAFADIDNNKFEAKIDNLSFNTNIESFNINAFSAELGVNPKELVVNELNLQTSCSDISINSKISGLNIFDTTFTDNLKYALIDFSASSNKFQFGDISAFVPPVDMLKDAVGFEIHASGNLVQLDVNKLVLDFDKTHLESKIIMRNVDNFDEFTISSQFRNSYINQNDIGKLLPEIELPKFEKLGSVKIDSLIFEGKPLNFRTKALLSAQAGKIKSDIKMNFQQPINEYDAAFSVSNFDLEPFASVTSNLNLSAHVLGKGLSPEKMNAEVKIFCNKSNVEEIALDSVLLDAQVSDGKIDFNLFAATEAVLADLGGEINLLSRNIEYKADGVVRNLSIGKLIQDTSISTNLNFKFRTEGESFNIDSTNMFFTVDLTKSEINGTVIDSIRTITDIFTDENNERVVNFISDFADITIKGEYSLTNLISVISKEAALSADAVQKKLNEILKKGSGEYSSNDMSEKRSIEKKSSSNHTEPIAASYLIDLKDFRIISPFLQDSRLEIDGDISGKIESDKDEIRISLNSNLNYVKYWGLSEAFFLSKINLSLELNNNFSLQSTEDINLKLKAAANRIFTGADMNDIFLNLDLKNNIASFDIGANVENKASAKLTAAADLSGTKIDLDISNLNIVYNGFDIHNKEKFGLSYQTDKIDFKNIVLYHSDGQLLINGFLAENEEQNLFVSIKNFEGSDLLQSFSNGNKSNSFNINLNLEGTIRGNYSNPIMNFNLKGNNLSFRGKNFGDLISTFDYSDKNLVSEVKFYSKFSSTSAPALLLRGNVPLNLSLTSNDERLIDNEQIGVSLSAKNLDLTPFGDLIPGVSKFKGILNSELTIEGTMKEPYPSGYLTLENSSFHLNYNNLEYDAALKVSVSQGNFSLDEFLLKNSSATKDGGKITGGGTAKLDHLNMVSSQFTFNGKLKVLGEETKYVSPSLYGDLVISTNGNFELKFDKSGANLKAPINFEVAKLTYSPVQSAYTSTSENFVYRFIEDTIKKETGEMDFETLVNLSKARKKQEVQSENKPSKFDYSIDVSVEDEAVFTYVLSKEFDQNLTAVLRGNFQYERIAGTPVAQGELELLEGSTLEFIKTFSAVGKIRFESELSNPYLDITATYKNYYFPESSSANGGNSQSSSEEVEVAVKMKIKGRLNELDKNLSQQSDKLTVYVGTKNIENNDADETKDASDAVMFMLLGKFKDDAVTQQDKLNVSSYATSFAGSLVGGFLNRQLGDYVKSLEIRQSGSDTKFILAGRAGKFRYSIGGSTSVFQDLGQANVKIEYPITRNFFMRLERKEALSESQYLNEMINELGLKYRFEF